MGPYEGEPGSGRRLLTCALLTGLLLTGGLALGGDQAAPSGLSGGVAPDPDREDQLGDSGRTADLADTRPPGRDSGFEPAFGWDVGQVFGRDSIDLTGDEPAALQALRRAATAKRRVAYSGTQFVSVWGPDGISTILVDLAHSPRRGTAVRLHGGSPEQARFVPGGATALPGAGDPRDDPGAASSEADVTAILDDVHVLSVAGPATSAGRAATVVDATRSSGILAARFWIDRATGLPLRREVYAPDGDLARSSGFVELAIGSAGFLPHLPPALPAETSRPVDAASYDDLAAEGWHCCRTRFAGVLRLTEVRRSAEDRMLLLAYTDGLTVTSVFQQRGELDVSALKGFTERRRGTAEVYVRYGLSSSAIWSAGGLVYTVVSDTPYGLDRAVAALPHDRAPGGVGRRLGRGMNKIASWLNPLD